MKWRATIKEVSSAIVNDDFEKVIGDILAIEELGYKKGCETFSARLKERTKITLEIARQEYEDEEQFAKRIYDVIESSNPYPRRLQPHIMRRIRTGAPCCVPIWVGIQIPSAQWRLQSAVHLPEQMRLRKNI